MIFGIRKEKWADDAWAVGLSRAIAQPAQLTQHMLEV